MTDLAFTKYLGLNMHITKETYETMTTYFDVKDILPVAEDNLCGFEEYYKKFLLHLDDLSKLLHGQVTAVSEEV